MTDMFAPKPALPYATRLEMLTFGTLVKNGTMSFFRIGYCKVCKAQMPKNKEYCSKKCYTKEVGDEV